MAPPHPHLASNDTQVYRQLTAKAASDHVGNLRQLRLRRQVPLRLIIYSTRKKGDSYGAVIVDTESRVERREEFIAEEENDGCKCGSNCTCADCKCGK
ncbi:hypothetical protein ACP4OV_031500 [Aristida adscensionis]